MPKLLQVLFLCVGLNAGAQGVFEIHGHRGFRGRFPENTITAFKEAAKAGADHIELDVVISRDSQVVVSHEPWFNAAICSEPDGTPVKKTHQHDLYRMNYSEIRRYDCGKRGNPKFPGQAMISEHKPLLSEVIDTMEAFTRRNGLPLIKYNIEIKSNRVGDEKYHPEPEVMADLVNEVITRYGINERVLIQSFDVRSLRKIHQLSPSLKIGLLTMKRRSFAQHIDQLGFSPDYLNPRAATCTKRLVSQAHKKSCKVVPWTVNSRRKMQRLKNKGVDGIITDYPDKAKKLADGQESRE